jgi:hypothetical protein
MFPEVKVHYPEAQWPREAEVLQISEQEPLAMGVAEISGGL